MGHKRKWKKESEIEKFESLDGLWEPYFYFIAGYTSNGTPYGMTWEEAIEDGLVKELNANGKLECVNVDIVANPGELPF